MTDDSSGTVADDSPGADTEIPLHRRSILYEAFEDGDDIRVRARLEDVRPWADGDRSVSLVHEMTLSVAVRVADMTITEAVADMHVFPHTECPAILAAFSGLVGLSVARGYTREVQSRFGGAKGCTHLEHLARSLGPVVVQAVTSRRARELSCGEIPDLLSGTSTPWARNSCHVWAEGGVAEQKLAAGWRPGTGPYPAPPSRRSAPRSAERVRDGTRRRSGGIGRAWVLGGAAFLATGCTSAGTAITTPFDTTPPALEHGPVDEVKVVNVTGLGTVLADGQGITLYMFATDKRDTPSRCYDICAVQWPPLVLTGGATRPIAGTGIRSSLLGTAPRTDGTTQVTYNGWPLYLWPPDRAPGTATGQALTNAGGRWYVLDPEGKPVTTP